MQKIVIGRQYAIEAIKAIKRARKNIRIVMYDWRWYSALNGSAIQKLNIEIMRAKARGVEIMAVVNREATQKILARIGISAAVVATRKTIHTKILMIDDQIAIVGSHNLTHNAMEVNIEVSVITDDYESICQLLAIHAALWSKKQL